MNARCLDESTVVAFLGGSVPAGERAAIESHLDECSSCKELTTWAAADFADRSRPAGSEGQPFVGQLASGSRVDRYQVLGAIGRGGMGEVYAAYHPDLDRRIALKVVYEAGGGLPERRARLLREARAIARLSHPNVITIYDAGTFDDRVYIAMEFVAGETVEQWLRSGTRSWREIVDVFVDAGRGLAAAHAANVVHRDFKPQNVMVGHDGSVRVMDFGLAQLAHEPIDVAEGRAPDEQPPQPVTVTKTGARVGTIAYMAPEQFRGDPLDARADQFSFCVALYEALYGCRPNLSHLRTASLPKTGETAGPTRSSGVPAWLRNTIARGLSADRERRFQSMGALLASITRGRVGARRRISALAIGVAVALLSVGGWRFAAARRVSCAVPRDRLAGAWIAGDQKDPKRLAIHRAFLATGRPSVEVSWQRVSKILDDYMGRWSSMYVETCEATHVRGEQPADVLDLRMSCLNDSLDQVRALTDVFVVADQAAVGHVVASAQALTPLSRCADVQLLRSAVPLPRDEASLRAVQELRRSMRDVQALWDTGNYTAAWRRASLIRAQAESTGYKPLLAEMTAAVGSEESESEGNPAKAESTLMDAVFIAESSRDDLTAAKAASHLIFVVGYRLGRPKDAALWLRFVNSALDRMGGGNDRVRAWAINNYGAVMARQGDTETARALTAQAIALKEKELGENDPDVAVSLGNLALLLMDLDRPGEALQAATRAIDIFTKYGDPDTPTLAKSYEERGEALFALGKHEAAEASFNEALRIFRMHPTRANRPDVADVLHGLGALRVVQARPTEAVQLLDEALSIREEQEPRAIRIAETRFTLARALWDEGRDRRRALSLAREAQKNFAALATAARERAASAWLATHRRGS
jgi:eukaryotic-like serine/threonine-protein kinase